MARNQDPRVALIKRLKSVQSGRAPLPPAARSFQKGFFELAERAHMPSDVAGAKLIASERTIQLGGRYPMACKTDQAFRTAGGLVVLVETKTHHDLTIEALVQISATAYAMNNVSGWGAIASHGYIRHVTHQSPPFYRRVQLLPAAAIERLWERWADLQSTDEVASTRAGLVRCRSCSRAISCPSSALNPAKLI